MLVTRMWVLAGAICWTPAAVAQTTLGALLDAGAQPLSVAQFEAEVVQRIIVGPTPTGGELEVICAKSGAVQGRFPRYGSAAGRLPVDGEWRAEGTLKICTAMTITASSGSSVQLPSRCQYWFKLGNKYFLADSDTDRSAKVLVRTIKQ